MKAPNLSAYMPSSIGAARNQAGLNGSSGQTSLQPGQEAPTPAEIPQDDGNPNQSVLLAAILGGSALIGTLIGCVMFRNKRSAGGDSDSDADTDDDDNSDDSD